VDNPTVDRRLEKSFLAFIASNSSFSMGFCPKRGQ
jgi:hypothetical protein